MARTLAKEKLASMEAVQQAWNYSFWGALFNRRARRFPLGAEMPGGFTAYKSSHEPVPLDEIEEAMLVAAGTGISGLNLADLPFRNKEGKNWAGNTMIQFTGRTYPSGCGSHGTDLFFTNDDGMYMVKMKDVKPDKLREFATLDDQEKILSMFREHTVKLSDNRLDIPRSIPSLASFNQWNVNMPGTTLFTPITDLTFETINVMMLLLDEPNNYYFIDEGNGNAEPLKKWADEGRLNRRLASGLHAFERNSCIFNTGIEQGIMSQNMYLAAQTMGLGGWVLGAGATQVVMGGTPLTKGYGFRHVPGKSGRHLGGFGVAGANPVGIDGVFEAYCPPYYPNMDAAVQAVYDYKFGTKGIYTPNGGPVPFNDRKAMETNVPVTSEAALQMTKDLCNYVYETYGRFPASVDAMQMCAWFQAHHLETEFYDKFYGPEAYHKAVADHMKVWHGK